jgi:hypothetical protein
LRFHVTAFLHHLDLLSTIFKPLLFYSSMLSLIKMALKGSGLQTAVSAVVDIAAATRHP